MSTLALLLAGPSISKLMVLWNCWSVVNINFIMSSCYFFHLVSCHFSEIHLVHMDIDVFSFDGYVSRTLWYIHGHLGGQRLVVTLLKVYPIQLSSTLCNLLFQDELSMLDKLSMLAWLANLSKAAGIALTKKEDWTVIPLSYTSSL